MRAAIAFVVLFSVLSAPIASAMCRDCCNRSVDNRVPLCHDKAHAHLGPHVHHVNHEHMVTQDSDANISVQRCEQQFEARRLSCHSNACLSAKPVQAFVAAVSQYQLEFSPSLLAATLCGSPTISVPLRPFDFCRIASSSSQSASVPLRV